MTFSSDDEYVTKSDACLPDDTWDLVGVCGAYELSKRSNILFKMGDLVRIRVASFTMYGDGDLRGSFVGVVGADCSDLM